MLRTETDQTDRVRDLIDTGPRFAEADAVRLNRLFRGADTSEMLETLIPQEDEEATKELAKQFKKRGIALQIGKQCTRVDDDGSQLTVHFGEGESVQADLMLVSVGRAPLVEGIGLEQAGVQFDPRQRIATDDHRRTSVAHIYAVGDCAGHWQLAHTAFREGEVAAENAMRAAASRAWSRTRSGVVAAVRPKGWVVLMVSTPMSDVGAVRWCWSS